MCSYQMNDNYTPNNTEKGQIPMLTCFLNELSQPSLKCTHHTDKVWILKFFKIRLLLFSDLKWEISEGLKSF